MLPQIRMFPLAANGTLAVFQSKHTGQARALLEDNHRYPLNVRSKLMPGCSRPPASSKNEDETGHA